MHKESKYTRKLRKEMLASGHIPLDGKDTEDFFFHRRRTVRRDFEQGADELLAKMLEENSELKDQLEKARLLERQQQFEWRNNIKLGLIKKKRRSKKRRVFTSN